MDERDTSAGRERVDASSRVHAGHGGMWAMWICIAMMLLLILTFFFR